MLKSFSLESKRIVITGAAGVICSEIAEAVAEAGASVALLDLFEDKAQVVADRINRAGRNAIAIKADVLDKDSLIMAKNKVISEFGGVDILINGAGGNKKEATTSQELSFFNIPESALRWVFDINFSGIVMTTQVFGEEIAKSGRGCVINISSMAAILPLTNTIAYSAAKAAVSNFTQWMAVHFNHNYSKEIRVNAIAPGFLLTQQNKYLMLDEKTGSPTKRGQMVLDKTPMNRYGDPSELTGAIVWLCSEAASFVNGAIIPIDGGFSAYSGV